MNGLLHFENGDRKLPDSLNVLPETSQVRKSIIRFRYTNVVNEILFLDFIQIIYPHIIFQIKGLHTFVRNRNTSRDEFIFYSKRLIRLVVEYALSLQPFETVTIQTPQGIPYEGKRCSVKRICGVSILRAGETMEAALTEVCKDIRVGKILIQTSRETGEPELYYLRLPKGALLKYLNF